jgi:hypothetical protein
VADRRAPAAAVLLALGLVLGVGLSLVLSGCTATPAPKPTPSATAAPVDTALKAKPPATLTAASAATETKRLADAMQALIDPSLVVHSDDTAQLVPATTGAGSYYGDIRIIQINSQVDPSDMAKGLVSALKDAGWVVQQTADEGQTYLTSMTSSTDAATSWLVLVGGDASVAGQSVLSLKLASPDLP